MITMGREKSKCYEMEQILYMVEGNEQNTFVNSTENSHRGLVRSNAEQHVKFGVCLDEPLKGYLEPFFDAIRSSVDSKSSFVTEKQKDIRNEKFEVKNNL